jgi:hypothetical protein
MNSTINISINIDRLIEKVEVSIVPTRPETDLTEHPESECEFRASLEQRLNNEFEILPKLISKHVSGTLAGLGYFSKKHH